MDVCQNNDSVFVHHSKKKKQNTKADSFLAQSSLFFLPLRLNPCVRNCAGNKGNAERREAETRPRRHPAKLNEMKAPAQRRRRRDKHPDICHMPSTCHHFQEGPVSPAVSMSIGISFSPFFLPRVIYPRAGVSDYAHNKWQVEIIGHKCWNRVGCDDSFSFFSSVIGLKKGGGGGRLTHCCCMSLLIFIINHSGWWLRQIGFAERWGWVRGSRQSKSSQNASDVTTGGPLTWCWF